MGSACTTYSESHHPLLSAPLLPSSKTHPPSAGTTAMASQLTSLLPPWWPIIHFSTPKPEEFSKLSEYDTHQYIFPSLSPPFYPPFTEIDRLVEYPIVSSFSSSNENGARKVVPRVGIFLVVVSYYVLKKFGMEKLQGINTTCLVNPTFQKTAEKNQRCNRWKRRLTDTQRSHLKAPSYFRET